MQSVDPTLLALNVANTTAQNAKKKVLPSLSTQAIAKPSLNVQTQQPQATFTPPTAKVGGISSPFGAANINSAPILWWATPTEIKETATQLQTLPKAMPETWATEWKKISKTELKTILDKMPDNESRKLAITKLQERWHKIEWLDYEWWGDNFITNLWSWIGQSVTWFGNLWKKLAFWAVDLYRQSQGKEKLTPEQRASVEATPMGQALNTITNRQTPEQKASVWWQIGMVAGSVAQWAALWTPISSAVSKIPWVANIVAKAPILSKIAWGIWQGLEWQAQYSLSAEWRLPTGKELFTAWAFWWAVNAIWPIAKWIKDMKNPKINAPFRETRNKIAEWIVWSNLKNPAMREKYISKVWQTPEKTLLDEWITWSLWSQATKVADKSKQAYDATRTALKSIPTQFKSDEWLWITNKILEWVDTSIPWIEDVIAPIKDMNTRFANGSASAMDMNDAKLLLARFEGLYDDFWRVKKTGDEFEKKALAKMYNNMKTEIENVWEQYGIDIKSMNKETQKREWLRGLMDRAVSREAGRDMISLSDYMLWWITIADPMTAIPLTLWKKFFSSPKVSSKIAKFLYSKWDDVITNSASNAGLNVADWATKQGLKYPIKLSSEWPQTLWATLPKPTPKTPPITVEKGAIGMWTPKPKSTAVLPPKPTVAPSVSTPKVDTFKRITELDSNPLYKKLSGSEILWWWKLKQWVYESPLWTVTNEIMDGKVKKYVVNGKSYNASDLWGIREKQAPEVVAQANIASKAISDLKAIEKWQGKTYGSSLKSVLDELGIDKVDNIPEWAEAEVLKMVRARSTPPTPKWFKWLWKETMEQNPVVKDFIYHWWEIDDYTKLNADYKFSNDMDIWRVAAEWPWIYFTSSSSEASWYWSKIIKWLVSDWANIIDDSSKKLTRSQISNVIKKLPQEIKIDIAQNRDENINRWLEQAIDSLVDWDTPHDQLMNIWADVFNRRDVKWFMDVANKLWIDWVKVKKPSWYHVVVYNKSILDAWSKNLPPLPKKWK